MTDRIIAQGRALVRAIEALGTIEPTGPIERALARLLLVAWCVLLVFVGQQVGLTLQGRPGAAILTLAVGVAGGAVVGWLYHTEGGQVNE